MNGCGEMDTLRASEMLQDAGLDPATAKAVVTVVHDSVETAAATKLDLRNTEGRLNKKIDTKFTILDKKIDAVHGELKDEIADVRVELAELNGKIDTASSELNGKIDTGLAEVRAEITASATRTSREMVLAITLATLVIGVLANAEAIWTSLF